MAGKKYERQKVGPSKPEIANSQCRRSWRIEP